MRLMLLPALFSCACVPRALIDDARDRDDDSYIAWQLGGDDCDDAEPAANPSEPELCGDGIDNNCDGAIDDDGTNSATWYPDLDGDGFAIDAPITACTQPEKHRASLDAGLDCDDTNSAVHPGAPDAWYDGIDSNCDAKDDYDQDGDTYRDPSGGGNDCDDLDGATHPGAPEVCGNHRDDDCDGTHNTCAWSGDFEPTAGRSTVFVINSDRQDPVSISIGDVTGDGLLDVAARNPVADDLVFVFFSPFLTVETAGQADVRIELETSSSFLMQVPVISADLNGDGRNDLLVPEHGGDNDKQLVYQAPLRGSATLADATRTYAAVPDAAFPTVTIVLGDQDGDGKASWLAEKWTGSLPDIQTECFLVEGMPFGDTINAVASLIWPGCPTLFPAPDMNSDGTTELAFVADGHLHFLDGNLSGLPPEGVVASWALSDEDASAVGPPAVWSDFDGDGTTDVLVRRTDVNGFDLIQGPFEDGFTESRMAFRTDLGFNVGHVAHGDFNGDDNLDIVGIGGTVDPETSEFSMHFAIWFGPFEIPGPPPAPGARILVPGPLSIPFTPNVGDIDNDGFDDLAFGHWDVAYVVYGKGR